MSERSAAAFHDQSSGGEGHGRDGPGKWSGGGDGGRRVGNHPPSHIANLTSTGMRAAAESAGAKVLALEDEPWVRLEPPDAKAIGHFYFSRPVYDADVVINMPVIKTHRFAEFSCSLKKFRGRGPPALSSIRHILERGLARAYWKSTSRFIPC